MTRRVDKPKTDEVVGGVLTLFSRIAPVVCLKRPSLWTENFDQVAALHEFPIGVAQLGPPKTNGPAGLLRDRGVRGDEGDTLWFLRIEHINCPTHGVPPINRDDAVTQFDGLPWRSVSPHLPTTSSNPRDIGQFVVLHLLNVPDKRLHERKELFEAVIPTESLQMILGRGPFDAQHESLRFLSAVGQFVS